MPSDSVSSDRYWTIIVSTLASLILSAPLLLEGTPDVESYSFSIFSTRAFVHNVLTGGDPWFVPEYGFGIPLPSSSWLIKFPPAFLAAFSGVDALYAAVWLGGHFVFGFYLLELTRTLTRHRGIGLFVLATGLLSYSSLGTTYADDWPENFLGWALFPACLWFMIRTLLADSPRARVNRGALCALVLGIFAGTAHQNEIVTFFSGVGLVMAALAWKRPAGVATLAIASAIALASAADVLIPTVQGLSMGSVNPLVGDIAVEADDLTLASYGVFLEPARSLAAGNTGVWQVPYERVPFFGVIALVLASIGAARLLAGRIVTELPPDVARAIGFGFVIYSMLTLLPSWVALGLPRMWMYRDGQTVFAVLCAAAILESWRRDRPRIAGTMMLLQIAQIVLVASPFVIRVLQSGDVELFGYARHERLLFAGLRDTGIDAHSRVMLAGRLEGMIRGRMPAAGVTDGTDFPLEGVSLVNAAYRGGGTPALGGASMERRYGAYETLITWNRSLKHMTPAALDVLGITHVLALDGDTEATDWTATLTLAGTIDLPGERRVQVYRNDDAWNRVELLPAEVNDPPQREACPTSTVFCRDFDAMAPVRLASPAATWHGSQVLVTLPPGHPGGRLFVSAAVGPTPSAAVDQAPRAVRPFLDTFATVDITSSDRQVVISLARRQSAELTLLGVGLLGLCLVGAIVTRPRRGVTPAQVRA